MYYASIGILAFLILLINNYDVLKRISNIDKIPVLKAYKTFLISVLAYYATDVLWEVLLYFHLLKLLFLETSIYFFVMALTVMLWTKYVIAYLNKEKRIAFFLVSTGQIFLFLQIAVIATNFFIPIAFWFDEDGTYHTSIARLIILLFQILIFLIVSIHMLFVTSKTDGNIQRRHYAIGFFSIIMVIFIVLGAFYPLMPFFSMGYMLGTCLLHTFVLEDEKEVRRNELEKLLQVEQIQEAELGTTRKLAYSDPLTGIKNKMAYLEDIASLEHRITNKCIFEFGVIVFDINDLKHINDTKGHDAGDQYIKSACTLICNQFKHSPVYRIGGDEFVAILNGEDYKNHEHILKAFNSQIEENISQNQIVIACGFSEFQPKSDKTYCQIFERADKKMYKRKQELKSLKAKQTSR